MPQVSELNEADKKRHKLEVKKQASALLENPVFDDALVKQVKEFQLAKGLVPDGIVGTQTVIQLNTVIGSGIPILIDKHEDNQ